MSGALKTTGGKFSKGQSGNPVGRPPGSPNKLTTEAKEVIAQAAEGLGGVQRLIDWAKESPENEAKFWAGIYPRLIPVQLANAPGETFKLEQVVNDADAFTRSITGVVARITTGSGTGQTQH